MADVKIAGQLIRLRQRATAPLILELDLTDGLTDRPPTDLISGLVAMRRTKLSDILDGLDRARKDARVRAVIAKVGAPLGLARVQEIRDAIIGFRSSGKPAIAWAESFGEFTHGNLPYYLATAFDKIYLQPSGSAGLTGVQVEQLFLHDALAKAGIDFQSAKRYEYKSAADTFTERGFTGPAREATERLTESVTEQLANAIAGRRGKTPEQARDLLNRGPFLAEQAKDEGLIDALAYRDEVYADVRRQAGQDAVLLYIARYNRMHTLAERARHLPRAPKERFVGLIHASGPIKQGRSGRGPFGDGPMGSDTISAALRSAADDDRVRAVVLRVNSPGGSYTASDTIWREVVRMRASGKPVVVSMSNVAASGGYFISMAADAIVAEPGTLTGSIGVILGKPVFEGLLDRVGVTIDTAGEGTRARMFAPTHPFTEDEWERVNSWLDAIYRDFTAKVAQGRDMTQDRVHELARGRVWTGADARENGLVDELGGLGPLWTSRASGPAFPPTRRCAHTRAPRRWTSSARPSRARPVRPPPPVSSTAWAPTAGARPGRSRPAPACRRTGR